MATTKTLVNDKLVIYSIDNKTLVEITHLVESQLKTINSLSKVIELLEDNAKLKESCDSAWDELNHINNTFIYNIN